MSKAVGNKAGADGPAGKGFAVYALTLPGLRVAEAIAKGLPAELHLPERLSGKTGMVSTAFGSLAPHLREAFGKYRGHVLVAATGLVVREIAPLLRDKTTDPAVVTLGQDGRHVISLLSGHLGGGNELAEKVAAITGGIAVINTATDIAGAPALEMVARDLGLHILDPGPLAAVSRELSEGAKVPLYDPLGVLAEALGPWEGRFPRIPEGGAFGGGAPAGPSVYVDYRAGDFPKNALVLIPKALALGVGCHKGIAFATLWDFVSEVFARECLYAQAVSVVATADIRREEPAILGLAGSLGSPLAAYGKEELAGVRPPNPSDTVLRRIGVPSVCEAAAMLAAKTGTLLVPKQKNRVATMAVARMSSLS